MEVLASPLDLRIYRYLPQLQAVWLTYRAHPNVDPRFGSVDPPSTQPPTALDGIAMLRGERERHGELQRDHENLSLSISFLEMSPWTRGLTSGSTVSQPLYALPCATPAGCYVSHSLPCPGPSIS